MPLLFITSLCVSLMAAVCVWGMGRKDPCGKPWLTGLCLGTLLLLPLLSLFPKIKVEVAQIAPVKEVAASGWAVGEILAIVWGGVALMMLIRLCISRMKLQRWLSEADEIESDGLLRESANLLGVKSLPQLKVKSGLTSPVVAGMWRPVILLPETSETWSEETRKMAILHEMGHVQRRDLWVRFAADVACALHWYNPLVWWLRGKLLSQCEYACDALIISSGASKKCYITALCDVVESALNEARPQGVLAMADHAPLQLRVNRLLGGAKASKPWVAITAAVLTVSSALGLSLVRPAAVVEVLASEKQKTVYTVEEIELRHSANPFPGN